MKSSDRKGKSRETNPEGNDLSGMSKFSPRHNMVKIAACAALIIRLLTQVIRILTQVRIRTVEGGIWIRRLGMGNPDYRV